MKTTIFPQRDFRIVGRNPKHDMLDRWLAMLPERRKRLFVDTHQAADIAGVSPRTIVDWIHSGKVISIRIGRKHKIHLKSLKTYLCGESED